MLYSLVFGEGVMNDATSVALLRVIQVSASSRRLVDEEVQFLTINDSLASQMPQMPSEGATMKDLCSQDGQGCSQLYCPTWLLGIPCLNRLEQNATTRFEKLRME